MFKQSIQSKQSRWIIFGAVVVLIVLGVVVYSNSFNCGFLFDDETQILQNENVHSWAWPWAFVQNVRRPLLYITLTANHTLGQENPFGYHLFNLAVHLLASIWLFLIVLRAVRDEGGPTIQNMAFALTAAALWMVHPLQTQSVTYIIQRAESLMGMLFLLSLLCAQKYFDTRQRVWVWASLMAGLLSGLTKEVAIVLPVVIYLYDYVFVSKGWKEAWRSHRLLYLSLGVIWSVMFLLYATMFPEKSPTAGFSYQGIAPLQYAINQPFSVLRYIQLAFWPHPLIFDYNLSMQTDPFLLYATVLPVVLMLGLSFVLLVRVPRVGFLAAVFFIILSPSSSFIPLKDLIFEHRMYLPLASVLLLSMLAVRSFVDSIVDQPSSRYEAKLVLTVLLVMGLGFLTFQRNKDYKNEEIMWKDVLTKVPGNSRAQNNYGGELFARGAVDEALPYYFRAVGLDPEYADAYLNIGTYYAQKGEPILSEEYSRKAIALEPRFAIAYNNLGASLSDQERFEESIVCFKKALELDFRRPGVYLNLGVSQAMTGRPMLAIKNLEEVIRQKPGHEDARRYLEQIRRKLADVRKKQLAPR